MVMELLIRYAKVLMGFAVIWAGLWAFNNYGCARVNSKEMEPTIRDGGFKLLLPQVRTPEEIECEDLVYFDFEQSKDQTSFAARVVGEPGDKIKMVKGEVFRKPEGPRRFCGHGQAIGGGHARSDRAEGLLLGPL